MSCGRDHQSHHDHHHHHDHDEHRHHHDDPDRHEHHDHEHHKASHHPPEKLSDRDKLGKMIEHWIQHNEEHARSFRDWANRARTTGDEEVARVLEEVADHSGVQNEELKKALGLLNR